VYVIARQPDYDALWAKRHALLREWGDVVWTDDIVNFEGFGFDVVRFELADGVDGEVAFAHTGSFMAMHGGPYRIFVDREGLLDGVEFPLV
jgi:hypothetical protein